MTATLAPCPVPFNLADYVLAPVRTVPDKIALEVVTAAGAQRWSFARLAAAVRCTGTGLLQAGLRPGARVLLRLGNTVDFPVAFLGAAAAGLVPVPSPAALTAPEATRLARLVAPALVIADDTTARPDHPAPVLGLDALRAMRALPPCAWDMGAPDRPGYIVLTSGSSGAPRAVVHAHRAVWARQIMRDGWTGLRAEDRVLHAGAFNWTYTLGTGLLDPWAAGATALVPGPDAPLGLLLRRHGATIFAAVPGVYRRLSADGRARDLPALRHGLSAGEALPAATRTAWQAATDRPVFEALGMSECSTFVSASPDRPAPAGAVGYAQPGRRIAVLDAGGGAHDTGTGTLAVYRSDPGLMLGYLPHPGAAPALPLHGDWFATGDRVCIAPDGAVKYLGREDDMMTAGGYRVAPSEVEAALAATDGVDEIAVTQIAVRDGVEVIAAGYTGTAAPDALQAAAAAGLARYKQPRRYRRLAALPRAGNGKLSRRALRAALEDDHDHA